KDAIRTVAGMYVGYLFPRWINDDNSPAIDVSSGFTASNCSKNPQGEAWWPKADPKFAGDPTPGCNGTTSLIAPYQPVCGNGGYKYSVMSRSSCGWDGFDEIEKAWIQGSI